MPMKVREWARRLRRDIGAIWLAARDPRVPWHAKALAGLVAAYALSPIDLIPDFIPVLGFLDELIVLPAGLWLVARLIPREIMEELRAKAEAAAATPRSWTAAAVIVAVWLGLAILLGWLVYRYFALGETAPGQGAR
jgi:uncharacterized membrane protein YkvA (DUF1232 family)